MKFSSLHIAVFEILLFNCLCVTAQPEWQKKYKDTEVKSMFAEPPMFYAPHVFWFWDDTIRDEKFTSSMAQEMIKQRLNPGYAHPRSSMERLNPKYASLPYDQYLEKPWFNSFGNALQTAKSKGFTLGYCDEYDWPSGQAAGKVLKQHPELEAKYLDWKRHEVAANTTVKYDSVDFAVAAKISNNKIDAASLTLIGEGKNIQWKAPAGNWVVYTYAKKFHAGLDGGKVNYLDPNLMKVFIPIVHEQYAKHFGADMGNAIPGSFVDNEGDYGWRMAWSEYLPQRYKEMKKRDMRLWLPLLTEKDKAGLYAKARCDWFDVVSDVYNSCYFVPIVNWLKQHNMYYISNLWEESLLLQTAAMGDFMRVTRTATMPGTDCLLMKSQDVHDFKEVQTVAELEDRPFMSEIMGVAGWEQTPAMIKSTINSITSFGVNHVVPHGINVNRKVETDPFPADWFTENPYWPYLHQWTDFARRAAFVTRQSKLVADVLLINPMETIWANSEGVFSHDEGYTITDGPEVWDELSLKSNRLYSDAMRRMNENNIDFLIADKHYLTNGKAQTTNAHTKFTINDHQFSAMILPPASVMSHAALDKILDFAKQGGVVILLGETPVGSPENGATDPLIQKKVAELKKQKNVVDISTDQNNLATMINALNQKIGQQMRFENAGRLYTAHRKMGSTDLYWLANNTDTIRNFTAWFKEGNGFAEIWNCEYGNVILQPSSKENGYNKVSLSLQPYEGYWLAFNPQPKAGSEAVFTKREVNEIALTGNWNISYPGVDTICRTSAKALVSKEKTLDESKLQVAVMDTGWKYYPFMADAFEKRIAGNDKDAKQKLDDMKGNYVYWRMIIPAGAKTILFPINAKLNEIWIDGKKTNFSSSVSLPADAKLLSFAIAIGTDQLPAVPVQFITGNKVERPLQSWYNYGLTQYTGYVDYETIITKSEGKTFSLDLGNAKYMAEVFVNGNSIGARLWPPFIFDISKELKEGDNKIKVRIGNLMVNEMWKNDDLGKLRTWGWVGAPDFDKYDAGLFGPVKLLVTK